MTMTATSTRQEKQDEAKHYRYTIIRLPPPTIGEAANCNSYNMRLATRTARRGSRPRTQYAPRATPTAIPLSRREGGVLLPGLRRPAPSALGRARLRFHLHSGIVRVGALPATHRDVDGRSATGALGPTSFSRIPAVTVDRGWRGARRYELGSGFGFFFWGGVSFGFGFTRKDV